MSTPRRPVRRPDAWTRGLLAGAVACGALLFLLPMPAHAQDGEPIAAAGHGGFFDRDGTQIALTPGFVAEAQRWYRDRLLADLDPAQRREFAGFQKRLQAGLRVEGQERLLLEHQSLEWLLANTKNQPLKLQSAGKLRALEYAMNWKLPAQADLKVPDKRERFEPSAEVIKRIDKLAQKPRGGLTRSATVNSGAAYVGECSMAGVPTPPTINLMDPAGLAGWKSQGFIPTGDLFIEGTPAEVRTFQSTSPEGMCIALPRYTDATLSEAYLDGVICMGKQTSKVCFWDNQWTLPGATRPVGFSIPAGTQIPIGAPVTAGGKYQAGGKEIEFGPGNVCTDCHAGENPYIIHPKTNLAPAGSPVKRWETLSRAPQNLPTMAVNRYDPIVAASWPQNQLSQAGSTLLGECSGCHVKGDAGRFPHLSNQIPQYCSTILAQAITRTMPPGAGGTALAAGNAFKNMWCPNSPSAGSADTGDPHVITTNGIHYDFQAAGEFTALRNADTGFELQTRQSPVLTDFIPDANAHTGLASCVSLNTAAALRIGKRRVTVQQAGRERVQVRVDGRLVDAARGIDLGGGNRVSKAAAGGPVETRLADGTRVLVTPVFWASQGYWYLDVQVFGTTAREGVMGPMLPGEWLPRAPDGTSFGARPAALPDRHVQLNQKFADAWRVDASSSLFDYAPGTSTDDFTDRAWPAEPGKACTATTIAGNPPHVKEPRPDLAEKVCSRIRDPKILADCVFDVTVMGDAVAAKGHVQADRLRAALRSAGGVAVR